MDTIARREGARTKSNVRQTIDEIKSAIKRKGDKNRSKEKQIMLEIAYHSIYALRNSRDAAHSNPTPISQWDARHIIETATWLLEEFLRIYGNLSKEVIENIFYLFSLPTDIFRIVENIDGKIVPLVEDLRIKDLVLLVLISNNCLTPKEIINAIPNVKPNSVYVILHKLEKEHLIIKNSRKKCYRITSKGRRFIYNKIKENSKFKS